MIQIIAKNGKTYDIRSAGQNLEIERDDEDTGLRKVFVFKSFSIGSYETKHKQAVFYSYLIAGNKRVGETIHILPDNAEGFAAFNLSALWQLLQESIVDSFLLHVDSTTRDNQ